MAGTAGAQCWVDGGTSTLLPKFGGLVYLLVWCLLKSRCLQVYIECLLTFRRCSVIGMLCPLCDEVLPRPSGPLARPVLGSHGEHNLVTQYNTLKYLTDGDCVQ